MCTSYFYIFVTFRIAFVDTGCKFTVKYITEFLHPRFCNKNFAYSTLLYCLKPSSLIKLDVSYFHVSVFWILILRVLSGVVSLTRSAYLSEKSSLTPLRKVYRLRYICKFSKTLFFYSDLNMERYGFFYLYVIISIDVKPVSNVFYILMKHVILN